MPVGENSTACGPGTPGDPVAFPAEAVGEESTAVGHAAWAQSDGATAIGAHAFAGDAGLGSTGTDATAVGRWAFATGDRSIAIGFQQGAEPGAYSSDSIAIGTAAIAGTVGDPIGTANAVAVGNGAQALGLNSVALGPGAVATLDNQMMLGTTSTSYYLPGLPAGPPASDGHVMVSVDPATGQLTTAPVTVLGSGLQMGTLNATTSITTPLLDSTDIQTQTITASGAATFNGTSEFNAASTFNALATFTSGIQTTTLETSGNATVGGELTVTGLANLNGGVQTTTLETSGLATLDSLDVTNSSTFNGAATFNSTATFNDGATITSGGLGVTGGTTTDTLVVTGSTTTNGITNTGNIQTTTLNATTSITTPLLEATTANVETVNVGTAFSAAPGATIDMGGNRVQNVGAPVVGTDAANKAYVDAGLNSAFKKIDENTQGVAIALAMGGIYVPDSKAFSLSAGYGTFGGANAFATQMALRMNASTIVTGGVGVGLDHGDAPTQAGGRLGFQVSW